MKIISFGPRLLVKNNLADRHFPYRMLFGQKLTAWCVPFSEFVWVCQCWAIFNYFQLTKLLNFNPFSNLIEIRPNVNQPSDFRLKDKEPKLPLILQPWARLIFLVRISWCVWYWCKFFTIVCYQCKCLPQSGIFLA